MHVLLSYVGHMYVYTFFISVLLTVLYHLVYAFNAVDFKRAKQSKFYEFNERFVYIVSILTH